ncbi:pilus assembly protein [Oerskovia sp. Sa1BUA8]|uniref:Pilus assembly protein n=1 Tax=Oerskovia douganii TaxID=2762210 RepID=A0A9D5UDM1_9CELL|nr:TadE/TadG family type IV pilus assembly protein [Oerskovia douganii]MBE7699032.1 pilus assembly protein [Oerskovia douganii]
MRRDKERGSSTIEILGMLPVVVVTLFVLLQLCAFTWAVAGANQAVRDGARAKSLDRPVAAAVEASLPSGLSVHSLRVEGERVVLQVEVPRIAVFPSMTVQREATMPGTIS